MVSRLAASFLFALFLLCAFHTTAAAQIILDGMITEPDWHQLGTSTGGPPPSFGTGHEINALYADINATHFYVGVAGNVQFGNRILVFIDSISGGCDSGNFGRTAAPPGISTFNSGTVFDDNFTPNYILSISSSTGQTNYFWDLYTLPGSCGADGGPNLFLGDRNNEDLRANPANADQTRGFEARLTYSANGSGVDIAINQPRIRMMAMYINDSGVVSNQFISRAGAGQTGDFGSGPILFNAENTPNPVSFAHMLVINEVDYIQPGANVAEFIEIKNITNIPLSLDSYRLRFARGINSPPDIYREINLPDGIVIGPGAYFVVCTNVTNVPNCSFPVEPPMDLLENSIPAAVALLQNTLIIDVVSYGGNVGSPYSEGAGVVPTDDGTQPALGISRIVDGMDTNRNVVDFALRCVTPGQSNSAQTGGCGPATPTFTLTPTPSPTGTSQTPTPTGTSTPTSTPTPTGSVTPTATGSVTAPPPAGCSNVLVNGDFESAHGWEFGGSPVPGKYTSIPVRGGIRSIQLGIPPETSITPVYSYSSVRQAVSVPRGSTIQLRWWHFFKTELSTLDHTDNNQDRQEVILLKPNGDTLRVVQRVRRNDSNWQQSIIDLTEYAGHNFVLYFNVINYGGGRTWMFLDDVELLVCPPQGSTSHSGGSTNYGTASQAYYDAQYGGQGGGMTATPTPTGTQQATVTPTHTPSPTSPDVEAARILEPAEGEGGDNGEPDGDSGGTPTPTVTPTNTGVPTATPSVTGEEVSYAPTESELALAQQLTPQPDQVPDQVSESQLASQPTETQPVAPQAVAILQPQPTPTVFLITSRQVIPENCIELIDNGTFEARSLGWNHGAGKILPLFAAPTVTHGAPSSGLAIRLGLVDQIDVAGISAAEQLVELPKDHNKITLFFRYYPQIEGSPSRGDFQYVDIYHGESGQFVGRALGVQRDDRTWIEREYDLSALAGEAVRLYFMVSNDGVGGSIAMYIDDVSILACRVPKLQPQNRLTISQPGALPSNDATNETAIGNSGTPQPLAFADAVTLDTPAEEPGTEAIVPVQGFSFGRLGGLLAVLGIAGAALVLLPLTRRYSK